MNIQSIKIGKKGLEKSLGELEGSIMEVLWRSNDPLSAREVTDLIQTKKEISFNAVSTVLKRLEAKEMLVKKAQGKRYSFAPTMSKKEYSQSIISSGILSLLKDKNLLSAAGLSGTKTEGIDPKAMKALEDFLKQHENNE